MSAQSLSSYLAEVRDRDMTLLDSWKTRYGKSKKQHHRPFSVWTIRPLNDVTADDVLWCLVAAAHKRKKTHLHLYVFAGTAGDADEEVGRIYYELCSLGFKPMDFDPYWRDDGSSEGIIVISLFSEFEHCTALNLVH